MPAALPRNTAFALRLAPGESADLLWRIDDVPADPALSARMEGGDGGLSILSLHTFRQLRVPYSEEELREFPPAMRDRLRRDGRLEYIDDGTAGPGGSLAVQAGGALEVRFEIAAGSAKGRFIAGAAVLSGPAWGEVRAQVVAVVGGGGLRVEPHPSKLRLLVAPGRSAIRSIVITPPAAARVMAVLGSDSPHLAIASVDAFRTDRVPATAEELAELPPALRDQVAQHGFVVLTRVASVPAATPVEVPAGGSLQVGVTVTAPDRPPPFTEGLVSIVGDRWESAHVPVIAIISEVQVALESDRLVLEQGGEAGTVTLVVRAAGQPPSVVELSMGQDDPWRVEPSRTSVPLSGVLRQQLSISATAEAAVGVQLANLFIHWFDGLESTFLPLTIEVRPGRVEVMALTPHLSAPQGGGATATLRLTAVAATSVSFDPAFLPPGVTLLPIDRSSFSAGVHDFSASLRIDPLAPARPGQRIAIHWSAAGGAHRGVIELRLTTMRVPAERTLERPVVTPAGMPLGGRVAFTVSNDGSGRFRGHMRATGALSFHFRLHVMLRSADGLLGLLEQEEGEVHGTFDAGSRQHEWDRPLSRGFLPELWSRVATAELSVARGTELAGIAGGAVNALTDLIDTLAGLGVLLPLVPGGHALAALVFASSELRELTGVRVVGPAGLVGVLATAGGMMLLGPGALIPVFLTSSLITDLAVRHREARPAERVFAQEVFGTTLPWDRIRLTNLTGFGDRPFVCPNADGQILVNLGAHLFDAPTVTKALGSNGQPKDWVPGQTFIHELTHVWQIARGSGVDADFVLRGVFEQVVLGDAAYSYGPPGPPFSDFGIEGSAKLVEEWFAGRRLSDGTFAAGSSESDPYFRYIAGNIRTGVR